MTPADLDRDQSARLPASPIGAALDEHMADVLAGDAGDARGAALSLAGSTTGNGETER